MTHPPRLTDPDALRRNRAKARRDALFLHDTARDELQDRLSLVNRTFHDVAVVTPYPDLWTDVFPGARMVPEGDVLALEERSCDLVIHALSLHWADDPVGQIIQCARALRADGLFMAAVPGGQTLHELRSALAQAEARVTGGLSPRVLPMADIRDLGSLLQRAGLALPVADALPLRASYATPWHLMRDLRQMGEANALAGRTRHLTRRAVLEHAADLYAQTYGQPDGRIPATFEIIFLHGWAPDASQPKPLRPGSAAMRLAEALNTTETRLKD